MSPAAPRRVLILVDCYFDPYGGTEGQLHALLEGLPPHWRAEMWVLQPSRWLKRNEFPVRTRNLGLRSLARPLSLSRWHALARQIQRMGFDLIQTYMNDASILGPLLGAWAKVPVLIARRDLGFWQTPLQLQALRRTNRLTRGVIANCRAVAEHTVDAEHVPPHLLRVVSNGQDPALFDAPPAPGLREELGIPEDAPIVALLANVKPLKRHDDLLAALERLAPSFPDVHALCLGEPVEDDLPLLEKARRRGLEGRVHLHFAPGNAVPLLKHADVGVLCSETEGLSNAVLEYMGCGLPVVASSVGGNPELVADGESGLLFAPGDVEALARHLEILLADSFLARRMGAAGRRRFEAGYTRAGMVAETTAAWTAAVEAPGATRLPVAWEVVEDLARLETIAEDWAGLLAPGRYFVGPDWVLAWLGTRREEGTPHVLVGRAPDGALIAVLPLARSPAGSLRLPGSGYGADHLDIAARPEHALDAARSALAFLEGRKWTRLDLPHLAEDAALRVALHEETWTLPFTERLATVCPYVRVEGTYEDYVRTHFSYATRRNVRRYPKRFRKLEGARVERIRDAREAGAAVDRFYALHRRRFDAREETSALVEPGLQAFHRALAERAAKADCLAMTFLVLGSEDVACEYAFRHGGKLLAFQSGFDEKAPFESPGVVLQAIVMEEDVFGAGFEEYDFLDGAEEYKLRWATDERRLFDVVVFRPTLLGRASALVRGAARIVYATISR